MKTKISFDKIYYEPNIEKDPLGKFLLRKYKKLEQIPIVSHNNIESLRQKENKDFPKLKRYLILGTRKTHHYTENHKISDYLVPFTSSGCSAMCLYCYLVCNYNKCSYLRIFTNTQEILDKLVLHANTAEKECTYEIGSNSDLLLENLVTENLQEHLTFFLKHAAKGRLTFPTKFDAIEPLLELEHQDRILPRMSLNPASIITKVELGTSSLTERLLAINTLSEVGYPTHILIAPIILTDNYQQEYETLLIEMKKTLSEKAKSHIVFELIFMTYSYIHRKINEEAFPNAIVLYQKEKMTSRGIGKYHYKNTLKEEATVFFEHLIASHFDHYEIKYIV